MILRQLPMIVHYIGKFVLLNICKFDGCAWQVGRRFSFEKLTISLCIDRNLFSCFVRYFLFQSFIQTLYKERNWRTLQEEYGKEWFFDERGSIRHSGFTCSTSRTVETLPLNGSRSHGHDLFFNSGIVLSCPFTCSL